MNVLVYLVPLALLLGLGGLFAFLWSLRSGQYDDLDGAAVRVLSDDDLPADDTPASSSPKGGGRETRCARTRAPSGHAGLRVRSAAGRPGQRQRPARRLHLRPRHGLRLRRAGADGGLRRAAAGRRAAGAAADLVTWPFAAMLLGAALASFPASFLRDAFGRRTGFALGASVGIAGGALLVAALIQRQFAWACLGALWLGMAQGFSFFYRHEAAAASGRPAAATAGVLAGGLRRRGRADAGRHRRGPRRALLPGRRSGPGGAGPHLLPRRRGDAGGRPDLDLPTQGDGAAFSHRLADAGGGAAWFGMNAVMSGAPLALVGCGIGGAAVFGFIALHVAAMYAPAVPLALAGTACRPSPSPLPASRSSPSACRCSVWRRRRASPPRSSASVPAGRSRP